MKMAIGLTDRERGGEQSVRPRKVSSLACDFHYEAGL